jgi:glycosyltransferase involved in cell wall biosynthesis
MRLLIVSDAWHPQVNGVVRTLSQIQMRLRERGVDAIVMGPEGVSVSCPTYPEIRLTLQPSKHIRNLMQYWQPDAIHIATEGPLGWAMRRYCYERSWPYTTSFHTRFPEYVKRRFGFPRRWTYRIIKSFHQKAECILVPTPSVARDLEIVGLSQTRVWGRGVDTQVFHPGNKAALNLRGPILLHVGRLAPEKNVEAFLRLKVRGTKVVVGDGPSRASLEKRYGRSAHFLGSRFGSELASIYSAADVFVFPSLTDTFGLVQLEALACGTPVAALPSSAAHDVLSSNLVGAIDTDLARAIERALTLNPKHARAFAESHSWEKCADVFQKALVPFQSGEPAYHGPKPPNPLLNNLYYALHRL